MTLPVGVRSTLIVLLVGCLLITGCVGSGQITPSLEPTAPADSTETAEAGIDPTGTPSATETTPAPVRLVVWLPPQFDPYSGSEEGILLAARLALFEEQNPGVIIEVRLKAPSGAGGLLESLSAARAAAPLATPGVVALTRTDLEAAALKGLILPLDDMEGVIDDADWYPYARQLARINDVLFGLPFAGDAMLTVYRVAEAGELFKSEGVLAWPTLIGQSHPVIFPAASPQAFMTLDLYLNLGGEIVDSSGRPTLNAERLTRVYETYTQGVLNGALPPWITGLENDAQAWQAFREGRGDILITWTSSYLQDLPADAEAVPLGGMDGAAYTLANGWLWAVSDPIPERRELSMKLAVFLSQSDFLSTWSEASALLPTRPSSLAAWNNQSLAAMLNRVAISAQARPDSVILVGVTPALHDTVLDVLKQKNTAEEAALQAAGRLALPNE